MEVTVRADDGKKAQKGSEKKTKQKNKTGLLETLVKSRVVVN